MCVKNKEIGKRIKELRSYLRLTQREFADRIYSSYRSVQNWEAGERFISDSNLRLLIDEYGVSPEWIATGEGDIFLTENERSASETFVPACEIIKTPHTFGRKDLLAFVCESGSMSPVISKGDVVLWKKQETPKLKHGSYAVLLKNGRLNVRKVSVENGLQYLVTGNGDSEIYKTDDSETVCLGFVTEIFSLKSLLPRE